MPQNEPAATTTADPPDAPDPQLVALLVTLHVESSAGKPFCSLPKLSKRLGMRMSTLQRAVSQLDGSALIRIEPAASGGATVALTTSGHALAQALAAKT